ncbi:hypothetical protein [Sphingomonas zeae]
MAALVPLPDMRSAARTAAGHWFLGVGAVSLGMALALSRLAPGGLPVEPIVLVLLCVIVPSAYWLCYRRGRTRKALVIQVAGLICVALLAASYLLPDGHRDITDRLRVPRFVAVGILAALEVGVGVRLFSSAFGRAPDIDRIAADTGLPRWVTTIVVMEARFWRWMAGLLSLRRLLALPRNRLLRHDALILHRELSSALTGLGNVVILAVVAVVILAQLLQFGSGPMRTDPWLSAAIGLTLGFVAQRRIAARLTLFGDRTPLASSALLHEARAEYALASHLLFLATLGGLVLLSGASVAVLGGYFAGLLAAAGVAWLLTFAVRRQDVTAVRSSVQRRLRSFLLLACSVLLASAATSIDLLVQDRIGSPPGAAVLALATFIVQSRLCRLDQRRVRLLAFAGYGPLRTAAVLLRAPALLGLGTIVAGAAVAGAGGALALLVLNVLTLGLASLRVLLLRLYRPRRADLLLVLGCSLIALVVAMAAPAAPVVTILAAAGLYRRSQAATWAPA